MPVIRGQLVPGIGPALGSLSLSALPPYGPKSLGQLCATINGQSPGTVLSVLVAETGVFTISPDQTQLLAGPYYVPTTPIVRIREGGLGYANSPILNQWDTNGYVGLTFPKIAAGA